MEKYDYDFKRQVIEAYQKSERDYGTLAQRLVSP